MAIEPTLLDKLVANIDTLASIYQKPPISFVRIEKDENMYWEN